AAPGPDRAVGPDDLGQPLRQELPDGGAPADHEPARLPGGLGLGQQLVDLPPCGGVEDLAPARHRDSGEPTCASLALVDRALAVSALRHRSPPPSGWPRARPPPWAATPSAPRTSASRPTAAHAGTPPGRRSSGAQCSRCPA